MGYYKIWIIDHQ